MNIATIIWKHQEVCGDAPHDILTNSESFKLKMKITEKTPANGNKKDLKIAVPLEYLSTFWRTLEMP